MSDFIREVDEEVRRDRVARFLARFWPLLLLVAVAIVAGAGIWRFRSDRQVSAAEAANARYDAASALAKGGQRDGARAAFTSLANQAPPGYALLARMRAIETRVASDPDGAAEAFDGVANDESASPAMGALARLRGAFIRIDHEDPKAFDQRYGRFSSTDFPFHDSMRELLALAALKRNDDATATRYLTQIITDPLTPSALRSRAQAFEALAAAGPATKTDAAAPPMTVTAAPSPRAAPPPSPSTTPPPAPSSVPPTSPAAPPQAPPAR